MDTIGDVYEKTFGVRLDGDAPDVAEIPVGTPAGLTCQHAIELTRSFIARLSTSCGFRVRGTAKEAILKGLVAHLEEILHG